MISLWISLNIPTKLVSALVTIGAIATMVLPGPVNLDYTIRLYEGQKWQGRQVLEFSPAVLSAMQLDDPAVELYKRQLERLRTVESDPALSMVYTEQTRSDGWLVATAVGTGQGYTKLNELFFDGKAQINTTAFSGDQASVRIMSGGRNPGEIVSVGGTENWLIAGQQIIQSNADQVQLFNTARWINPFEIDIELTVIPGDPANSLVNLPLKFVRCGTRPNSSGAAINSRSACSHAYPRRNKCYPQRRLRNPVAQRRVETALPRNGKATTMAGHTLAGTKKCGPKRCMMVNGRNFWKYLRLSQMCSIEL